MVAINPVLQQYLTQVREAETISRASPNVGEAAKRLKLRGLPASVSLASLRSVFRKTDRESFQALSFAGYPESELLDAFNQLDKPAAATMAAKAREVGASTSATALHFIKQYPNLDFDSLFALVKVPGTVEGAFTATVSVKALSAEQIIRTGARYHNSRQFALSDGRFYPEPDVIVDLVRTRHPGTTQAVIWSWLLLAGYEPSMVWRQVQIGDFARTGLAQERVAMCFFQNFTAPNTNRPLSLERVVPIAIALDGTGSPDAGKADCFSKFLQSMRERAISRTIAAQLLDVVVVCVPAQAPTCSALRVPVIDSILQGAGYPPEKLR